MFLFRTFFTNFATFTARTYLVAISIIFISSVSKAFNFSNFVTLDVIILKTIVVVFFTLFYIFLIIFNFEEYFKNGEFKLYAIDLAFCGSLYLVSTNNIMEIFLGLEIIAFSTYALLATGKTKESTEAALKYFIYSVLGSLLLITSFIIIFEASGIVEFTELTLYADNTKIQIAGMIFVTAFFVKFGVGPFYHWAPPVYQAVPSSLFIFISAITKLPLLLGFYHVFKSTFFIPGSWSFYYIVALLVCGMFIAARDLISEKNIRRMFAYTSVINFSTGLLSLFTGVFDFKLFLIFNVIYLFFNVSAYVWHLILNSNNHIKFEKTIVDQFNKADKLSVFMLNTNLILNSGLPPITMFIFKMVVIGNMATTITQNFNFLGAYLSLFTLVCGLASYSAYFNIIKNVTYTPNSFVPEVLVTPNEKKYKAYTFGLCLTIVGIYFFLIITKSLFNLLNNFSLIKKAASLREKGKSKISLFFCLIEAKLLTALLICLCTKKRLYKSKKVVFKLKTLYN